MKPIKIDYKLAMAASQDHGNRHAKKHGRKVWNRDDYNAAVEKFNQLYPEEYITAITP